MRTYFLPKDLRKELRKIWGLPLFGSKKVVAKKFKKICQEKKFKKIITVGDYCSLYLSSDVKIFDGRIKRKENKLAAKLLKGKLNSDNPSGTIQKEVWPVIKKAIKNKKNVFINGEEDLLVIPAVLLSPSKTAVVYGFSPKGICLIEVSPKIKKELKELLKRFRTNYDNNS